MHSTAHSICTRLALLTLALALDATADVTLTATSPAGSSVLPAGATFDVDLTWSGTPAVAAADYAVTLSTSQLLLTGRSFDASLSPYDDTPYLASFPLATNRVDATWFKISGFTGKDLTLHFKVPDNYTGPALVNIGLVVDGVQDATATGLGFTTTGTTVNLARIGGSEYSVTFAANIDWSALTWTPAGFPAVGDKAILTRTGGNLTVDQAVIIAHLDWISDASTISSGTGGSITFDTADGTTSIIRIGRGSATGSSSGRAWLFDTAIVLNNDLRFDWYNPEKRGPRLGSVISDGSNGPKNLTIRYGPNGVNGGGTADHRFDLGIAGGAANTHSGGTTISTATTTPVLIANLRKANALGSGILTLGSNTNNLTVQCNGNNQTVRGVVSSTTASIASNVANTLFAIQPMDGDTHIFAGKLTGPNVALVVGAGGGGTGSGKQILTGANDFTGTTTVSGGTLLVNGSLAPGSAVTVSPGGTLGGTGTVNGPTTNQGTLAPGASVGALTLGAVTLDPDSNVELEFADWAGTSPGSGWDVLNCAGLTLAGTPADPLILKLVPLDLANFTETAKTFTIATSSTAIAGFATNALSINSSAMPGTGTWSVQLDATGNKLELVYSLGSAPSPYASWAVAMGLTDANQAPGMDPDHDGANNLAEFALDGEPLAGSLQGKVFVKLASVDGASNVLTLSAAVRSATAAFAAEGNNQKATDAADSLTYRVEAANTLADWGTPLVTEVTGPDAQLIHRDLPAPAAGWTYKTFRTDGSAVTDPSDFIRMQVTNP
jgi:autotransporter-associated beta strand protein